MQPTPDNDGHSAACVIQQFFHNYASLDSLELRQMELECDYFLTQGYYDYALNSCTIGLDRLRTSKMSYGRVFAFELHFKQCRSDVLYLMGKLAPCLGDTYSILEAVGDSDPKLRYHRVLALQRLACLYILLGADSLARPIITRLFDSPEFEHDNVNLILATRVVSGPLTYSAGDWHKARRYALLHEHPEVKELHLRRGSASALLVPATMGMLCVVQLLTAVVVGRTGSLLNALVASATVGATCAYGFQALNHELSHQLGFKWLNFAMMCCGSAFCNFPWAMYYSVYHKRHHAYTGSEKDRDGDILFIPWHSPPVLSLKRYPALLQLGLPAEIALKDHWGTRLLWTVVFAWCIYPMFLVSKWLYDKPHIPVPYFEGLSALVYGYVWWSAESWVGVLYLWASAAFSLGAFCHPFLGFWLIQHAHNKRMPWTTFKHGHPTNMNKIDMSDELFMEFIKKNKLQLLQPTVSYEGSVVWQWLNFGELCHVEHHDFPRIPFFRIGKLARLAPEFYRHLNTCNSVTASTREWLFAESDEKWMDMYGDFAGRQQHLFMKKYIGKGRRNAIPDDDGGTSGEDEVYEED